MELIISPRKPHSPWINARFVSCVLPEMLESSNLITFHGLANSSGYDTFLLDEERGRLLVGAEDHIFAFDLVNINRDHKQVRGHVL